MALWILGVIGLFILFILFGVRKKFRGPRRVAFVRCSGSCGDNGHLAADKPDLDHSCKNGCLGLGSCTKVCIRKAIQIRNGVAVVDQNRCIGCGACAKTCPQKLIEMVYFGKSMAVRCSSHKKGTEVRTVCPSGCIGCGLCVKQCEQGAITFNDNLAEIDSSKCIGCGRCADKCPVKVIVPAVATLKGK